jgi:preprotein translocase subunit SecG
MKTSTLLWVLGGIAVVVVIYFVLQPKRSVGPPSVLSGGSGSILDSANAGASKIKQFFGTLFGGSSAPSGASATDQSAALGAYDSASYSYGEA